MKTVVIASSNSHKVEELMQLFSEQGLDFDCIAMTDVVGPIVIEETGVTFEENAYI